MSPPLDICPACRPDHTGTGRRGFAGRDTGLILGAVAFALVAGIYLNDLPPLLNDPASWLRWFGRIAGGAGLLLLAYAAVRAARRIPFQDRIFRTRPRGPEWGYVYILKNSAMPGLFKVGYTADHPKTRARALHTTGVAARFQVVWFVHCDHARRVEQQAHRLLQSCRVAKGREFFRADPAELIATIKRAAAHVKEAASR